MVEAKKPHQVQLRERRNLAIDGVSHVDSFDDDTIVLATDMGTLTIRGHNLRIQHLDLEEGQFVAEGEFDSLSYTQSREAKARQGWQRMWR